MTDAQQDLEDTLDKAHQKYPEISALEGVDVKPLPTTSVVKKTETDVQDDYDYSRKKYYDLIQKGQDAIDELLFVASDSQEASTYEVIGKLIKTTSEVTKELLTLQKTIKEIDELAGGGKGKNITNNSIYVGSTDDLQKLIAKSQPNNDDTTTK